MRRIIFGTVVTILLLGGAWWFIHTSRARTPIADGITAIPADAALIFESRQVKSAWKKLSQTNIMWEELLGTETVKQLNAQAVSIDSALQLDPNIYSILDDRAVYVSLHPDKKNKFTALYIAGLPDLTWQDALEDYLEKSANRGKPIYTAEYVGDARIGVLQLQQGKLMYFGISEGIVVMSSSDALLKESLQQLRSGTSIAANSNFSKVKSSAGEHVDANVYVNYKQFPSLLNGMLNFETGEAANDLSDLAAYSGWDITIKPNELALSGFTAAGPKSFLSLFADQKPQEITLTKILPANTSAMLFFGLSNVQSFHNDSRIYRAEKTKDHSTDDVTNKLLTTPGLLLDWMESELALVITESPAEETSEHTYGVVRSNNTEQALADLDELADNFHTSAEETSPKENKPDTASYRGHRMGALGIKNVLSFLFGAAFKNVTEDYFAVVDNCIVFGNSPDALKTFIDDFESNRTLVNNRNYKAFEANMPAESNIFLYSCMSRSAGLYSSFLREELADDLGVRSELLKKFDAAGIQFSSGNKLFYSSIYLKYNPEQKQETGTLWEAQLDTTVSSRPYLLTNHNTKAKEVFVQDDANKIYLISNTGKIIWTKQLNEKIMSDVAQVDVLKNDKLQMVFNTRSYIYMYDRNGNEMPGFPLKLRSPATNAIALIDYEKNRDYRIFIATENKRIVCYKANGEQVTAFAFDKTEEQVVLPLQYFNAANKDHLCAVDIKGKVYILDRHGETRVKLEENMPQGLRSFFTEPGRDYNKSFIIAADTLGNIIRMSLAGKKESNSLQKFETSPFFDMHDLNNDKTKELIFLSRNELKVFSQDHSPLFSYAFRENISLPPLFFLFPDNTGKLGVVSDLTNELFLFNENGSVYNTFPLNGKTAFSIGDLNNEGHYNLVTGSAENSIFVYQLK
jgi:hypothetical protein